VFTLGEASTGATAGELGLIELLGPAALFLIIPDDTGSTAAVNQYAPPPEDLAAFPDAKRARSKTPVSGGGGLRRRWKDTDGQIYEWDYQHGKVELYDKRGRSLGEFDPDTGERTKDPDPKRRVEP
jgi:hypothetical protein